MSEDFEEWKKRKGMAPDEYDYGATAEERDWYTKHRARLREEEDIAEEEWMLSSSAEKDLDELYRIQKEKDRQASNGSETDDNDDDIEREAAREIDEKVHKKGTHTINLTLNKEIGLEPHKFDEHDEEIYARFARKEGGLAAMKQMEAEEKESRDYYANPFDYKAKHTEENRSRNLSEDIANTLSGVYKKDDEAKKEQESAERAAELASMSPKEREFAKKYPKLAKMKGGYEYLANRYANTSYQRQTIDLINAGCKEEDVCNYMDLKQYRDAAKREGLPQPTIDKINEKIVAYERRLEAQKHDAKRKKKADAVELAKLDKILNPNKPSPGGIRATAPREWQPKTNTSLRGRGNPTNVRLGGTSVAGMPTLSTPSINLSALTQPVRRPQQPQQPTPKETLTAVRQLHADKAAKAAYQRQLENERQNRRDAGYQQTFMQKGSNVTKKFVVSPARVRLDLARPSSGVQVVSKFRTPQIRTPNVQIASTNAYRLSPAIKNNKNVVQSAGNKSIKNSPVISGVARVHAGVANMVTPMKARAHNHRAQVFSAPNCKISDICKNTKVCGDGHTNRSFGVNVKIPDIMGMKKKKKNGKR